MSSISTYINKLRNNNQSLTSVMDPEYADKIMELTESNMKDIAKEKNAEQFFRAIYERVVQPALQKYEDERKQQQKATRSAYRAVGNHT